VDYGQGKALVGQILEVIETSGLIYFALVRVVIRVDNSSLLWNQLPVSLRQPRTSLSISDSPVRVAVLPSVPSTRHSSSITPFTLSFQALNLSFLQILPTLGLTPRILQTVIIIIIIIIFCKPTSTKTQAGKLGQTYKIMVATAIYSVIIITNEYYYTAIESKKTSRALNKKNKTSDSVTQDKNRSQTVRDQTSG